MKHGYWSVFEFSLSAFNWTKVELKLSNLAEREAELKPFNWTKVELKLGRITNNNTSAVTFNWTKVELKRVKCERMIIKKPLLIELR